MLIASKSLSVSETGEALHLVEVVSDHVAGPALSDSAPAQSQEFLNFRGDRAARLLHEETSNEGFLTSWASNILRLIQRQALEVAGLPLLPRNIIESILAKIIALERPPDTSDIHDIANQLLLEQDFPADAAEILVSVVGDYVAGIDPKTTEPRRQPSHEQSTGNFFLRCWALDIRNVISNRAKLSQFLLQNVTTEQILRILEGIIALKKERPDKAERISARPAVCFAKGEKSREPTTFDVEDTGEKTIWSATAAEMDFVKVVNECKMARGWTEVRFIMHPNPKRQTCKGPQQVTVYRTAVRKANKTTKDTKTVLHWEMRCQPKNFFWACEVVLDLKKPDVKWPVHLEQFLSITQRLPYRAPTANNIGWFVFKQTHSKTTQSFDAPQFVPAQFIEDAEQLAITRTEAKKALALIQDNKDDRINKKAARCLQEMEKEDWHVSAALHTSGDSCHFNIKFDKSREHLHIYVKRPRNGSEGKENKGLDFHVMRDGKVVKQRYLFEGITSSQEGTVYLQIAQRAERNRSTSRSAARGEIRSPSRASSTGSALAHEANPVAARRSSTPRGRRA